MTAVAVGWREPEDSVPQAKQSAPHWPLRDKPPKPIRQSTE